MPPRIYVLNCLRACKSSTSNTPLLSLPIRSFASSPVCLARSPPKKKKSQDPYTIALRNRKKAANLSRRAELVKERAVSLGDPVRGITTSFVESLATATPSENDLDTNIPKEKPHLNYALRPRDVENSLAISETLAVSRSAAKSRGTDLSHLSRLGQYRRIYESTLPDSDNAELEEAASRDPREQQLKEEAERQAQEHQTASTAIERITALENGSSRDRLRVNIARCVNMFGRHNTDQIFPPKAPSLKSVNSIEAASIRPDTNVETTIKRIGPDTGSSEVQIAILTAKIKTLADVLEQRGKGDKHNKRNLRLLVHRRQKLLQYLRKKDRGGPRWQHCINMLGLTEGTWRGEISL